MKPSQRLKPVQRINEFHEQRAAQALGEHNRQLETHRGRLKDLVEYQVEYGRKFLTQGQHGMSANRLRDYQAFMDNLSNAIAQQKEIIRQFEAENERLKRQWLAVHQRVKAVDNMVGRMVDTEKRHEERRDQRELDDRHNSIKPR